MQLNGQQKFRLACIVLLWLALVWLIVRGGQVTPYTLFFIACSAVIVFVPLYKKYARKPDV